MKKKDYNSLQERTQYDYVEFCNGLLIPCSTQVRKFSDVAEWWQKRDAEIFNKVVGNLWGEKYSYPIKNIWLTRPRGHDKTSSIARLVLWCILFRREGTTPLNIYAAAVDKEQAGILLDSLKEVANLNFPGLVKITRSSARCFGGKLTVLSSDVSSSYGLKANMIIFDELTHWTTPKSKSFFEAIWSGRSKIPNCITIVITNSGYKNSWQYRLLQELKTKTDWYIYDEPGRLAGWHGNIEELESGLSPENYRRLILNEWVELESVNLYNMFHECIASEIPSMSSFSKGVISIDFASERDLTAIAIVCVHKDTIYVLDVLANRWPQDELEQIIVRYYKELSSNMSVSVIADRYQMEYMKTRLKKAYGINMELIKPTSSFNKKAINNLYSAMKHYKVLFSNPYLGEYRGQTLDTEMKNVQFDISSGKVFSGDVATHDDRIHAIMYAVNYIIENGYVSSLGKGEFSPRIERKQDFHYNSNVFSIIKSAQHKASVFGIKPSEHFTYPRKEDNPKIMRIIRGIQELGERK